MMREVAHYWRHPGLPGVDLLRARFVTHRYGKHTHPSYTMGVIESGVEEFAHAGTTLRAGAGQVVAVNPEVVHTGHAGAPEGWRYRTLYPVPDIVAEIAAELGHPRGTPYFPEAVIDDDASAGQLRAAHRAAEGGDALAASSLLRLAIGGLLRRHASRAAEIGRWPSPPAAVRAAREILQDRKSVV